MGNKDCYLIKLKTGTLKLPKLLSCQKHLALAQNTGAILADG